MVISSLRPGLYRGSNLRPSLALVRYSRQQRAKFYFQKVTWLVELAVECLVTSEISEIVSGKCDNRIHFEKIKENEIEIEKSRFAIVRFRVELGTEKCKPRSFPKAKGKNQRQRRERFGEKLPPQIPLSIFNSTNFLFWFLFDFISAIFTWSFFLFLFFTGLMGSKA